jgi:hypothetical protein
MATGGFDVVLGNPPWEQIQLDPIEFFASADPDIAAAQNMSKRNALIARLATTNPTLHAEYKEQETAVERLQNFVHSSGRYPLSSYGRLNLAPLFLEASLAAMRRRAGLVLPTGLATDSFNQHLFRSIIESKKLVSLHDFENRKRLFPGIDSRSRLCLFTLGPGMETAEFAFMLTSTDQLMDERKLFNLSSADLRTFNPDTSTATIFRSTFDADLSRRIYSRIPHLSLQGTGQRPWPISFQLMFMMNTASSLFTTREELREAERQSESAEAIATDGYLPLYEAKMFGMFDHRAGSFETSGDSRGYRVLPETTVMEHADPAYEVLPFYYVPQSAVLERLGNRWSKRWLVSFKDVTSATNERTAICAILPFAGAGHSAPLVFIDAKPQLTCAFVACMNSLVFDYCARLKVGGLHLTFSYLRQLPFPPAEYFEDRYFQHIVPRVLELSYTSDSLAPFARDLGYDGPPFAWDEARRATLRAELDAWFARAYGLARDELRYVLDPADVMGPDYPSETFRVLKNNETRQYGEYRTRRLVLEAWDRMERGELPCPEPYDRSRVAAAAGAVQPQRNEDDAHGQSQLAFAEEATH